MFNVDVNFKTRMLTCYAIIIASLFFAETRAHSTEVEQVIDSYFKNKCLKNGGDRAYEDLVHGPEELSMCVIESLFSATFRDTGSALQYYCNEMRSTAYSCLVTFTKSVDQCLAKVEKYLPGFMLEWYNATFDQHCKNGAAELAEEYKTLANVDCRLPEEHSTDYVITQCFAKMTIMKDFRDPNFVIPKPAFCRYFDEGNICIINYIKQYCDPVFAKFVKDHFEPAKVWCAKYVNNAL